MGKVTIDQVETALDQVKSARALPGVVEVIQAEYESDEARVNAVIDHLESLIRNGRFYAPVADRRGCHAHRAIQVKNLLSVPTRAS